MDQSNYLLAKSDGVKDCVKWIDKRIKDYKKEKESSASNPYYELSWNRIDDAINELILVKISLEKYSKKLRHESEEV